MRIADFLNEDTVLVKPKKGKKKSLIVRQKFIIKDGNHKLNTPEDPNIYGVPKALKEKLEMLSSPKLQSRKEIKKFNPQ